MKRITFSAYRRFFFSLLTIAGLLFLALMWKGALPGGASSARNLLTSSAAMPKPIVNLQVSGAEFPAMALFGEEFCYTARITTNGDPNAGFAPYIRLSTPPGVSLASATLLGVGGNGVGTEPSTLTFTPATPTSAGTIPTTDPLTNSPVTSPAGHTLWIIQPPIGSVFTGQPAIDIRICLRTDATMAGILNQSLTVCHQPVYLYGVGSFGGGVVEGDPDCDSKVMPVVVKFRKRAPAASLNDAVGAAPLEAVTGNCYPIDFELVADIANGVTLTDLVFKDTFSTFTDNNGLVIPQFVRVTAAPVTVNGSANGVVVTNLTGQPGFEVTAPGPNYTGTTGTDDVVVRFQAFAQNQIDGSQCFTREATNTGMLNAKYLGSAIQPLTDQLRFEVKHVAMQKMAMPQQAVPGDEITYTINFQVSTDVTVQFPLITDLMPDGVSYVPSSAFLSGNINGNNISPIPMAPTKQTAQSDGSTQLEFGNLGTPFQFGNIGACSRATLTYRGQVNESYTSTNKPLLAADQLENKATLRYTKFNSQVTCSSEDAASRVIVSPSNMVTKAILNNPLPAEFKPGEEVRFSLKMCLPSGDAKDIKITDYLPAPIFNAATVTSASVIAFIQTPSVGATLNVPVASTLDNSVTFTITPDPLTTNPTTPVCFEIQFKVNVTTAPLPEKLSVTNYLQTQTVNTSGDIDTRAVGVALTVVSPKLTVTKSVCDTPGVDSAGNVSGLDAGDKVTFCVEVKNEGTAPAYSAKVTDIVPVAMTYVPSSLVQVGTTPSVTLDATNPATTGLMATADVLNPGQSFTIKFMATLKDTVAPCQTITNSAGIRWSADSAMPPPVSTIITGAPDTATVTIASPALTKTVKSTSENHTTGNQVTIGEEVIYEIKVCLPEGTIPAFTIQDVTPQNLTCLSATASGAFTGTLPCSGPWNIPALTIQGNNDPADNCVVIELKARVRDFAFNVGVPGNQTIITNLASISFQTCPAIPPAFADVIVVEPKLTIEKEMTPAAAKPGEPVMIKLTVTNNGTSPAYDVILQDFLPQALINPTAGTTPVGFNFSASGTSVTYSSQALFGIDPGTSKVFIFNTTAHVPCQMVQNTAIITQATTLIGTVAGERNYSNISDTASLEIKCECVTPPHFATKNMTAWWPFDEASGAAPATDLAGVEVNNGTKVIPIPIAGELVNRSLQFNGVSSFVQVPGTGADVNFGTGDFSIDAWVKPTVAQGIRPIVDKAGVILVGNTLTLSGYTLFLDNGRLRARVGTTLYPANNTTGPNISDNNWHHVALTVRRTGNPSLVLYIDGVQVFSTTNVTTANVTNIVDLTIGRGNHLVAFLKDYFSGRIDEVELFKVALTDDEVKSLYQAGSAGKCKCVEPPQKDSLISWWPLDVDGADIKGGFNGATVGTGNQFLPAKVGSGFKSGGITAINTGLIEVQHNSAFDLQQLTLDAWVKIDFFNKDSMPILWKGNFKGQDHTGTFSLFVTGSGDPEPPNRFMVLISNGSQGVASNHMMFSSQADLLSANAWYHVAVTVDTLNVCIYINGKVSKCEPRIIANIATNTKPIQIGGLTDQTTDPMFIDQSWFNGIIDEVELWNAALTPAEIEAVFKAGSAGKCKAECNLVCVNNQMPPATAGTPYGSVPLISGGTLNYNFSSTNLPQWLTLSTDGKVSGTPPQAGTYNFTVTWTDANGCIKKCEYKLVAGCQEPTITTASPLPNGTLGAGYNQVLSAQGGCGDYVFTQIGGTLPPGISLSPNGLLQGLAKACGTFDFTVQVTDKCGCTTIKVFSLLIEGSNCPCKLTIGPNTLPDGTKGTAYTGQQFTATGGTPPYTFSVTGNPLPPGLGFGSNGQISGTPLACGEFTLIVKATDSLGCTSDREYKLKINCSETGVVYDTDENPPAGFTTQQSTPARLTARINSQILGNENAIRFSLGFDPALLVNPRVTRGAGAGSATLEIDASELEQGNLGISLTQPAGVNFAAGRREMAVIAWEFAGTDRGKATRIEFKDSPTPRDIRDLSGAAVETQFTPSPVVLATKAAIVSAASYRGERIAPEEIVAAFGVRLATATQIANTLPLPTTLAGTTIKVRDSANVERLAPLFFVAPTQINYLIPAGTAAGAATVIITGGDGAVSGSVVEITNVAPGIFVADASGRGLPAANALTFKADGAQSSQSVARFDPAVSRFVAVPIDLGGAGDRVFLSLFGTGIRQRSSLENVRAIIGGVEAPVLYAGEQGGFAGLDQINLEIPRSLAGSGLVDVVLIVDGAIANVVQIGIL